MEESANTSATPKETPVAPVKKTPQKKKLTGERLAKYTKYGEEFESLKTQLSDLKSRWDDEVGAASDLLSKRPGAAFRKSADEKRKPVATKKRTDPERLGVEKTIVKEARGTFRPKALEVAEEIETKKARKNELKGKLARGWKKLDADTEF